MKLKNLIIVFFLLFAFMLYMQHKKTKREEADMNKKDELSIKESSSQKARGGKKTAPSGPGQIIKSVELTPKNINTDTDIVVKVQLNKKLKEGEELQYFFLVNGKMVEQNREGKLDHKFINKNQAVYCQVKLLKDNQLSETVFSPIVTVINSVPIIEDIKFPAIEGYGNYKITCQAKDIDMEELKFSLECAEELKEFLSIDEKTGTVNLDLKKGKKHPKEIKWTLKVEDKKGAYSTRTASINLGMKEVMVKPKEKKENEEE